MLSGRFFAAVVAMRLYLDTEFTSLDCQSQLISLALVDDNGRALYLESSELVEQAVSPWLGEHVLPGLRFALESADTCELAPWPEASADYARGNAQHLGECLRQWLRPYSQAPVWVDMGCWDWLHLVQLLGGGLRLPEALQMYPLELSTWLVAQGHAFDAPREQFALSPTNAHHALDDARQLRQIVQKLAPGHL